ncbi:MAG: Holliday junction branch migration protein RuvA [Nitrospira sp.]|nr:Holliday junction branch migration protein RuvA [Nitrospira sp.]MDD9859563.1 Holliday junction branch migration protein RuvA [Nitrospira sp.]
MIARLTGVLVTKDPARLVLDVHGIGFEVWIPLSTYFALPDLQTTLTLHIFTQQGEDATHLFGFLTSAEKQAFALLTKISGVGGKLALSVLSTLSIPDLAQAVLTNDIETLSSVRGVGKKSAGLMALALKDKIADLQGGDRDHHDPAVSASLHESKQDAISALVNLGYRPKEVKHAIDTVSRASSQPLSLDELIREGLKRLSKQ